MKGIGLHLLINKKNEQSSTKGKGKKVKINIQELLMKEGISEVCTVLGMDGLFGMNYERSPVTYLTWVKRDS